MRIAFRDRRLWGRAKWSGGAFATIVCGFLFATSATSALGCVAESPDDEPDPMCFSDADCDVANGEICDEGICYGDPPDTAFAGVLVPSGEGSGSLVQTVIPDLTIAQNGDISGLQFSEPLVITGKVTLFCSTLTMVAGLDCGSDAPIDASIRVERQPAFAGGPLFRQTFTAKSDVEETESSFTLTLPPIDPDGDGNIRPYHITVTPLDPTDNGSGVSAASIAPPLVDSDFTVPTSGDIEWRLGVPDETRWISSCLTGGAGVPDSFKDLPVSALAPDAISGELVRVSSRARTDNSGCFSLRVPVGLTSVTFSFQPDGDGPAPTILVDSETIPENEVIGTVNACFGGSPENAFCVPPIRGPDLTTASEIIVPITAQASEGGSAPVSGATVRMHADLLIPTDTGNPDRTGRVTASIEVRTTSSANPNRPTELGFATAMAPVNLTYQISVVPAPDSKFAALYGEPREILGPGVQAPVRLSRRIGVTGEIRNAAGEPIADATITVEPTVAFKLDYGPEQRAVLDAIALSTTTDDDGKFFMWVEGPIDLGAGVFGDAVVYSVAVVPPFLMGPPTQLGQVTTGANDSLDLGIIDLPAASWARGPVTNAAGDPVGGVELQVWQPNAIDPCASMSLPDGECPAAARRIGAWLADDNGTVRIVLPDP